jgi:hypothetical protein
MHPYSHIKSFIAKLGFFTQKSAYFAFLKLKSIITDAPRGFNVTHMPTNYDTY